MLKTFATICIIGMFTSSCTSKKASRTEGSHEAEQDLTMIVGTYTSGDSKGLYSFRFNEENGTATALSEAEVENPSYLVPSADGKFIYAVSEFSNEQAAANAFAFNKEEGTFRLLNTQKTGGEDPATSLPTEVMWLLPITVEEAFLSSRSIRTVHFSPLLRW